VRPVSCELLELPSSYDGLVVPVEWLLPPPQVPLELAPLVLEPLRELELPLECELPDDDERELEPPAVPRLETPPSLRVDAARPASAGRGKAISSANAPAAIANPLLPFIANLKLPMIFDLLVGQSAHPFPAAP